MQKTLLFLNNRHVRKDVRSAVPLCLFGTETGARSGHVESLAALSRPFLWGKPSLQAVLVGS